MTLVRNNWACFSEVALLYHKVNHFMFIYQNDTKIRSQLRGLTNILLRSWSLGNPDNLTVFKYIDWLTSYFEIDIVDSTVDDYI